MSEERRLTFMGAINEVISQSVEKDESVILVGTDVLGDTEVEHVQDDDTFGDVFGVMEGLAEEYSCKRVTDIPVSEYVTLSVAVGSAATRLRSAVELMLNDFTGFGLGPILDQGTKMRYMFGGRAKTLLVVRIIHSTGASTAAQHSQSLYNMFVTIPGVRVVVPSNPYNAEGLLMSAIQDGNLVVFPEDKTLLSQKSSAPRGPYTIETDKANVTRGGGDLTIVVIGKMIAVVEKTAGRLEENNVSVEVTDLRSVSLWDQGTVLESAEKTGRLITIDGSSPQYNIAGDVTSVISDIGFGCLDDPIKRATVPDIPVPLTSNLEAAYILNAGKVLGIASELVDDSKKASV